ncbi:MAG: hypothetical protein LBF22_02410 [Deltaproteobacteria bacterium]|jgi:hypothetical protein|nr:hypothetical protein [Deltaproteobacteria bacterium]
MNVFVVADISGYLRLRIKPVDPKEMARLSALISQSESVYSVSVNLLTGSLLIRYQQDAKADLMEKIFSSESGQEKECQMDFFVKEESPNDFCLKVANTVPQKGSNSGFGCPILIVRELSVVNKDSILGAGGLLKKLFTGISLLRGGKHGPFCNH